LSISPYEAGEAQSKIAELYSTNPEIVKECDGLSLREAKEKLTSIGETMQEAA
jgi:hypothetical protein